MMTSSDMLQTLPKRIASASSPASAVGAALDHVLEWRGYFWIGVYRVEGRRAKRVDFRGPYPPCHEFEFGKGNVGTVAMEGLKRAIPDVSQDATYSMCFTETRSEIVLPIRDPQDPTRVIGVMDVESDQIAFFTAEDERVLGEVCRLLAPRLVAG